MEGKNWRGKRRKKLAGKKARKNGEKKWWEKMAGKIRRETM
jgi:hypothetical protein